MTEHDHESLESPREEAVFRPDSSSLGEPPEYASVLYVDHSRQTPPPDELFRALDTLRRRARRLMWGYGISAVIVTLVTLTTLAAIVDWLFHLDDEILRLGIGMTILGLTGYVARKALWIPLSQPLSNLALARRYESLDRAWNERLSSVVQFLESNYDPALGSPAMQRRVARETLSRLHRLDANDVLRSKPVLNAGWLAIGTLVFSLALAGLDQSSAALAIERLVRPFSGIDWPREVDLVVLDESWKPWDGQRAENRFVQGEPLRIYIENQLGELPDDVALLIRSSAGHIRRETVRRLSVADEKNRPRDVAAASLMLEPGFWSLRATGGDDDRMNWQILEVVPPPALERISATMTPPAYSGIEVATVSLGSTPIRGLLGSRIAIEGVSNRPLMSASLRIKNRTPIPLAIDEQGLRISCELLIDEPGRYSYWFDLKDREGFRNPNARRYEIDGQIDSVPEVTLLSPRDDLTVTVDAVIPLEIQARDDRAIKQLFLEYQMGEGSTGSPVRHPLTEITTAIDASHNANRTDRDSSTDHRREMNWRDDWPLASLSLSEGSRLTFVAAASDFCDLTPDHAGRSRTRSLTVVSATQKRAELAARQEQMLKSLIEVHRMQRQARDEIRELNQQWQSVGKLRDDDLDDLRRVEREQRQISRQLFGPVTSVRQLANDWLLDYDNNRMSADELREQVTVLARELDWLNREIYPALDNELTQVTKQLGTRNGIPSETGSPPDKKRSSTRSPDSSSPTSSTDSSSNADLRNKAPSNRDDRDESTHQPDADANRRIDAGPDNDAPSNESLDTSHDSNSSQSNDRDEPARHFSSQSPKFSLARIGDYQSSALDTLDELVANISEWKNLQTIKTEWGQFIDEQKEISERTAEIGKSTLTKTQNQLTDQERAELNKAADKQHDLAERIRQFHDQLTRDILDNPEDEGEEQDLLREWSEELARSPLTGRMRDAGSSIRRNELGQTATTQTDIENDLDELNDLLKEQRETDTETLIKKIKQFEKTVEELERTQKEIARSLTPASSDGTDAPSNMPDDQREELVKKQKQNSDQTSRLAHRLKRSGLDESQQSIHRAGKEMEQAADELQSASDELAKLRKRSESIEQALQQGGRELAHARRELERQLARETLARLEQEIHGLIERQTSIVSEIERLRAEYELKERWTRAQLKTLRDVAEGEQLIEADTRQAATRLEQAPVFAYALKAIAETMQRTTTRLGERLADRETVELAETARRQLTDLLSTLIEPKDKTDSSQQTEPSSSESPIPQSGLPEIPQASQVRLLKQLQTEIRQETELWHKQHGEEREPSPAAIAQRESLAERQNDLNELARLLLKTLTEWDQEANHAKPSSDPEAESVEPNSDNAEDQPDSEVEDPSTSTLFPRRLRNPDRDDRRTTANRRRTVPFIFALASFSTTDDERDTAPSSETDATGNVDADKVDDEAEEDEPAEARPPGDDARESDESDTPSSGSPIQELTRLRELANEILNSMQGAGEQLTSGQAGIETQQSQLRAENSIDELMQQVERLSRSQQSANHESPDERKRRQKSGTGNADNTDSQHQGNNTADANGGRNRDNRPQDSSESVSRGESGEEQLSVPQHLAKEVWGHLPETVREQMLTLFSEKYLPRYEDLIRRYYEALAKEGSSDR